MRGMACGLIVAMSTLAGCGGGGEHDAGKAAGREWARGDRAIVLPTDRDDEIGWYPVVIEGHGSRGIWNVVTGGEVIVLGPGGTPDTVSVHIPAGSIAIPGDLDPVPPGGIDAELERRYLNRPD